MSESCECKNIDGDGYGDNIAGTRLVVRSNAIYAGGILEVSDGIRQVCGVIRLRFFGGGGRRVASNGFASRKTGAGLVNPGETRLPAYTRDLLLRKTSGFLGLWALGS